MLNRRLAVILKNIAVFVGKVVTFILRILLLGVLLVSATVILYSVTHRPSFSSGASFSELLMSCKNDEERGRLLQEQRSLPWRVNFYGKVVDMQGNPIPDATVDISCYPLKSVLLWCGPNRETLKTDKNGCFKKWNINVWRFFADASKDGYAPAPLRPPGDFKDHPWHSKKIPSSSPCAREAK
jgi:hypothetical protein